MVDSIPGFICINTAAGEVEHVNKTLLVYTGKPLAELLNWAIVVHPQDLPTVGERWVHSISTGDPFDVEVRVRGGDGGYRWFHCRGMPLRGENGGAADSDSDGDGELASLAGRVAVTCSLGAG